MVQMVMGLLMVVGIGGYLFYTYRNKDKAAAKNLAALGFAPGEGSRVTVGGTLEGRALSEAEKSSNASWAALGSQTFLTTDRKVFVSVTDSGRVVISDGTAPIGQFACAEVIKFERGAQIFQERPGNIGEPRPLQFTGPSGQVRDVYRFELSLGSGDAIRLLLPEDGGAALAAVFQS